MRELYCGCILYEDESVAVLCNKPGLNGLINSFRNKKFLTPVLLSQAVKE